MATIAAVMPLVQDVRRKIYLYSKVALDATDFIYANPSSSVYHQSSKLIKKLETELFEAVCLHSFTENTLYGPK